MTQLSGSEGTMTLAVGTQHRKLKMPTEPKRDKTVNKRGAYVIPTRQVQVQLLFEIVLSINMSL